MMTRVVNAESQNVVQGSLSSLPWLHMVVEARNVSDGGCLNGQLALPTSSGRLLCDIGRYNFHRRAVLVGKANTHRARDNLSLSSHPQLMNVHCENGEGDITHIYTPLHTTVLFRMQTSQSHNEWPKTLKSLLLLGAKIIEEDEKERVDLKPSTGVNTRVYHDVVSIIISSAINKLVS